MKNSFNKKMFLFVAIIVIKFGYSVEKLAYSNDLSSRYPDVSRKIINAIASTFTKEYLAYSDHFGQFEKIIFGDRRSSKETAKDLSETIPSAIITYLTNRRTRNRRVKSSKTQHNKRKSIVLEEGWNILEEVTPFDELESAYPGYSTQKVAEIKATLQEKYQVSPDDVEIFESFIFSLEELSKNRDLALLKSRNISAHIIDDLIEIRSALTMDFAGGIVGDQKIEIDSLMSLIPKKYKKIDVEVGTEASSLEALEAGGFCFSYGIFSPKQVSKVQTMLKGHDISKAHPEYLKYFEYIVLGPNDNVRNQAATLLRDKGISSEFIFSLRQRRKGSLGCAKKREKKKMECKQDALDQ